MNILYNKFKDCNSRQIDVAFIQACQNSDLEKIEYLLVSSELNQNANIHCGNDGIIDTLCSYSNLEVLKFLVSSPKLKEHISINSQDNLLFKKAIIFKRFDILNHLIFECNLEKDTSIQNILDRLSNKNGNFLNACKDSCKIVESMFEKRMLSLSLSNDLNTNERQKKQVKI